MALNERWAKWRDRVLGWVRGPVPASAPAHGNDALMRPTTPGALVFPQMDGLPAVTKAQVDAFLAALSVNIAKMAPPDLPSVLITGAMRCGKTLVAQNVCARTGMVHLPSDRLRAVTYHLTTGVERARLIRYIYKRILLTHPTGLVLEGTVFLDDGVTLPIWARRRGFPVFAIGYARANVNAKARSMIAFRKGNECWTKDRLSDQELRRMARKIIGRSRDIRDFCATNDMVYLDLDSSRFNDELRRVSRTIRRRLQAGGDDIRRPPAPVTTADPPVPSE